MSPTPAKAAPAPTLVVQPLPGIGDMVWYLPLIHAIARRTPGGRVAILTKRRSHADELLADDPAVAGILWLQRNPGPHGGVLGLLRLAATLRAHAFQTVWIFHQSLRYALAARLAGIPERRGYGIGWQRHLLTHGVPLPRDAWRAHPLDKASRFLQAQNIEPEEPEPRLPIDPARAQALVRRYAGCPRPWIAFGIGSSEGYKQWGAARFARLAEDGQRLFGGSVFLIGGPAERRLAEEIRGLAPPQVLAQPGHGLDVGEAAALLSRCDLYVGNDTGMLNVAAAVGTRAIGLFGASPPLRHSQKIFPVTPNNGKGDMVEIQVSEVITAITHILNLNFDKTT